jgi:hypothetical protein
MKKLKYKVIKGGSASTQNPKRAKVAQQVLRYWGHPTCTYPLEKNTIIYDEKCKATTYISVCV